VIARGLGSEVVRRREHGVLNKGNERRSLVATGKLTVATRFSGPVELVVMDTSRGLLVGSTPSLSPKSAMSRRKAGESHNPLLQFLRNPAEPPSPLTT
jgi:hypothetical protein